MQLILQVFVAFLWGAQVYLQNPKPILDDCLASVFFPNQAGGACVAFDCGRGIGCKLDVNDLSQKLTHLN